MTKAFEPQPAAASRKRLSYLDSLEWESMEDNILRAEQNLEQKKAAVQEAASDAARLQVCYQEMLSAQEEVDRLYARWAELETKLRGA